MTLELQGKRVLVIGAASGIGEAAAFAAAGAKLVAARAAVGQAADIAQAILFLATNPFVTGSTLAVDGGRAVE